MKPRPADCRNWLTAALPVCLAGLLMTWPTLAVAASFDCAKAATPTERTICAVEKLSILDEKMAKRFSEAKRNDPDNTLLADQQVWLRERNGCGSDEECLQASYWLRIATLAPYLKSVEYHPVAQLTREQDKLPYLQEVLNTGQFHDSFERPDSPICIARFEDLKRGENLVFVEPQVRADRYFSPALAPYRARRSQFHFNEQHHCEGKFFRNRPSYAPPFEALSSAEQRSRVRRGCQVYFGTSHFRVYHLPDALGGEDRILFYQERLNGPMQYYHTDDGEARNGYADGGYGSFDLNARTSGMVFGSATEDAVAAFHEPERLKMNISAIYQWRYDYYYLKLKEITGKRQKGQPIDYSLDVQKIMATKPIDGCSWTTVTLSIEALRRLGPDTLRRINPELLHRLSSDPSPAPEASP